MTNVNFGDSYLLSFGHATKEEKKALLAKYPGHKVYMDLTCFDPEEFYSEYPQLKGCFAALFCDDAKKMEIHFKEHSEEILTKLKELGYAPVETKILSLGFIFPRTIAQIINEAFFALEEKIATQSDIDRAMKFGVNYPKGPFEWAENRESIVLTLLEELLLKTGDKRYTPAPGLRSKKPS